MLTADSRRVGVPAAALLGLQVALFIALAGRGLDFTDEAFYLLSYQHGRDLAATTTFFGVFFEVPFRVLGGDVGAMRVFGLTLLAATGVHLAWRVFAYTRAEGSRMPWPWLVTGTAGSLLYYVHLTTLRAPSYNLLVLACIQWATALLLALADERAPPARAHRLAFVYGLALGVCGLTKAPSAVAVAVCHLAFLLGTTPARKLPAWAALASAGTAAVAFAMQVAHPQWADALRAGVAVATALDTGFGALPTVPARAALALGLGLLAIGGVAALLRPGLPRWLPSTLALAIVAAVMVPFAWPAAAKAWWLLMAAGAGLTTLIVLRCGPAAQAPSGQRRMLALGLLLLALPLCYSIGTNGSLAAHSRMAAGPALLALLLVLRRMQMLGLIQPAALAAALALPCLPLLGAQWRSLNDPAATYRLGTGLADQRSPTVVGREGRSLRLDAATQAAVNALTRQMAEAGYTPGMPILDMTGDGPGLVYALGGRPLGAAWLLGGYPGSERAAARALTDVPAGELRQAWVISADENPRALRGWADLLRSASGGGTIEVVGHVDWLPQDHPAGSMRTPVRLTLWRPAR